MPKSKASSPGRNQRPARSLPTRPSSPKLSNPKPPNQKRPYHAPPPQPAPQPHPQTPFEREQTTKRRGEISELAFALAAARHGFGIARPYGDSERYDLILDSAHIGLVIPNGAKGPVRNLLSSSTRPRLIRVQVKATTQLQYGLYRANAHRRIYGKAVPYTLDEIDFFVAYVIPEDSWFIFPLTHILGSTAVTLSPKRRRKPHINDPYRGAWHLLTQPDTLEFA
jgi:hypothetical protein